MGAALALPAATLVCALGLAASNRPDFVSDHASMKRIASDVASFALPHGYYLESASESGLAEGIWMKSDDPRYESFLLGIAGQRLHADLNESASSGTVRVAGFRNPCGDVHEHITRTSTDVLETAKREPITFEVIECSAGSKVYRVEFASFSSRYPFGIVSASGPAEFFDRSALVRLVASLS